MSLTVQADTPYTMVARYRTTQKPAIDATYAVAGELFFDPGREWTRTYLLIRSLEDITENLPAETTCPLFSIVGTVHAAGSSEAAIKYRVFDEYECAGYMQSVKLCFGEELASGVETGKILVGRGVLHSLDRLELQQLARPTSIPMPY